MKSVWYFLTSGFDLCVFTVHWFQMVQSWSENCACILLRYGQSLSSTCPWRCVSAKLGGFYSWQRWLMLLTVFSQPCSGGGYPLKRSSMNCKGQKLPSNRTGAFARAWLSAGYSCKFLNENQVNDTWSMAQMNFHATLVLHGLWIRIVKLLLKWDQSSHAVPDIALNCPVVMHYSFANSLSYFFVNLYTANNKLNIIIWV